MCRRKGHICDWKNNLVVCYSKPVILPNWNVSMWSLMDEANIRYTTGCNWHGNRSDCSLQDMNLIRAEVRLRQDIAIMIIQAAIRLKYLLFFALLFPLKQHEPFIGIINIYCLCSAAIKCTLWTQSE